MIVVNAFIKKSVYRNGCTASWHRRSRGGTKGSMPPTKVLENIVILWFARRFSEQK